MALVYGSVSVSQSSPKPFFSKPQFITQSDLNFIFIIMFLFCDLGVDLRYVFIYYIYIYFTPLSKKRKKKKTDFKNKKHHKKIFSTMSCDRYFLKEKIEMQCRKYVFCGKHLCFATRAQFQITQPSIGLGQCQYFTWLTGKMLEKVTVTVKAIDKNIY